MGAFGQVVMMRGGESVAALNARPVPHRVILRALPYAIPRRFDPSAAGDLRAELELRVRHPAGGEPAPFALTIADGRCEVRPGRATDPGAAVTIGADDLIRIASGIVGFPQLLASGQLEFGGDPFLALRFPALFRLSPRSRAWPDARSWAREST